MHAWILPLVLGAGQAAGQADEAMESAKAELVTIVKKVEEATSYTFTCKTLTNEALEKAEDELPENTKPVRGGTRRDVWTVEYVRDRPVHYLKGHADFVRDGNRYVAIGRNDEWQRIELPPPAEGDAAGRTERTEKARGIARMAVEIERMPLPHALLAELRAAVAEVVRAEKEGKLEFVATLTREGARGLMGGTRGGTAGGTGGGASRPPPERPASPETQAPPAPPSWSGTARFVATPEGVLERFELDLVAKLPSGERKLRREYELSAIGATTSTYPPQALEALKQD